MALQVQHFPKENFDQSSVHLMPHVSVHCWSWFNSPEQHFPESPFKNLSLKIDSPPQNSQGTKHLAFQLQDQDSSSTQATSKSQQELTAMGKTKSLDQCISSASVHDESYRQCVEGPMKPMFLMGTSEFGINPLQVDTGHSMPRIPYAYSDPYGGGIFTAYGPQAVIRPQAVGIAPAQLPLPLDLAEDGPIYVNAKQYHGIIRRRQIRAKLEAQNKLVKSRRPYLHESRHVHALKRVRGSGGRFLSTKKPQPPDPTPATSSHFGLDSAQFSQKRGVSNVSFPLETSKHNASVTSRSGIKRATDGGVLLQQPDHRFSSLSPHMQGSGGRLMSNVTQHRAPVVR